MRLATKALLAAGLWLSGGCLSGGVPVAAGETVPPAQAVADNGVFLEHAPPPAQPAAVCIVDSGVDLNPDTAGQVVFREALDGGDPGDVSPDKHGTLMAMMAAAPVNGWGMVGAAPGAVKIVSVRVEEPGGGEVAYEALERGVVACQSLESTYGIRVVLLSLAGVSPPRGRDEALLEDSVDAARTHGLNVVAAAGNGGAGVESPASYPPVLAVGASDARQALCPFSARGPGMDIAAPGCGLDTPISGTNAQGTSEAAALVASAVAALRAYRPDLSVNASEQLIRSRLILDIGAAFTAAGLGAMVDPGTLLPDLASREHPALPFPRFRISTELRHVLIKITNRPRGARVRVVRAEREFGPRVGAFHAEYLTSNISIPRNRRMSTVRLFFVDASGRNGPRVDIALRRLTG